MKKFLFFLLTLWFVLWAQLLINRITGGTWVVLNAALIIVLYFGLARGPLVGQAMGFLWGLLLDASALGLLGLNALLFALAGYLAGMLRRQLDETKAWTQAIFSFAVSVLYLLFDLGFSGLFSSAARPIAWPVVVQPFVNAVAAPLCFWVIHRWADAWGLGPIER